MTTALDPTLLLAAAGEVTYSTDIPGPVGVRPFGLTHITIVPNDALVALDDLRYDPVRQVNVDGRPGTDQAVRMGTSQDTRYDNQWFTDKDPHRSRRARADQHLWPSGREGPVIEVVPSGALHEAKTTITRRSMANRGSAVAATAAQTMCDRDDDPVTDLLRGRRRLPVVQVPIGRAGMV